MRGRRIAAYVAAGVGVVVAVLVLVVLVVTMTEWGRERVRRFAVDQIAAALNGQLEVGRLEGSLLGRVRLVDVAIRDAEGRPFLEADTLEIGYGLRALLRQRVELEGVRIVRAAVVLDQPPGEEWNYARIFGLGDEPVAPGPPGWGDWVSLEEVTLVDSRLTVRSEWRPPTGLTPAERDATIREAIRGDSRERVVEVPGGYQNVMEFSRLDARVPRFVATHPDSAGTAFEVDRMSGLVRPFSSPPARVERIAGEFRVVRDSLFMSGVRAELPASRLSGGGVYALHSGDLRLIAVGEPASFPDLRWLYPPLPERGGGRMVLDLDLRSASTRLRVSDMDVAIGDGRVRGRLEVVTGDRLAIGDTDLRFDRLDAGVVERLVDVELPRPGSLTGRLAIEGSTRALTVDGDIRFDDAGGAVSRIAAEGGLGVDPAPRFRELRLRFSPLDAGLARAAVPGLPLRGTVDGEARLTGSLERLAVDADLALRDPRHGLSRVALTGGIDRRASLRLEGMDVRMDPLRLDLFRDEVPELPAGATATGRVLLDGSPSTALAVDGDIVLDDPASGASGIGATGRVAFGEALRFDDLRVRADPVRVDLLRRWIPDLPEGGTVQGEARLDGTPAGLLHVDGQLAHHHPDMASSRVRVTGGMELAGAVGFRALDVRMEPLHTDLVRAFAPDLPLGGTLAGRATLDGSTAARLAVRGDVTHEDAGERSRVAGAVDVDTRPGGAAILDVRLDPLSLEAAGRFAPAAGLRGSVAGRLRAEGTLADLRLDADLRTGQGGTLEAGGTLDLESPDAPGYDLELELGEFDLAAVTWRAPAATDLTGTVAARGRGLDPATLRASVTADLRSSAVEEVRADVVRLRAELAAGLLRVDRGRVRLGGAEAEVDGAFGLVEGQEGVLSYRIAVDSLHAFAPWLPGADTAVVPPAEPPAEPPRVAPDTAILAGDTAPADPPEAAAAAPGWSPPLTDGAVLADRQYVAGDGARVAETVTRVRTHIDRPDDDPVRPPAGVAGALVRAEGQPGDTAAAAAQPHPLQADSAPGLAVAPDSLAGAVRAEGTLRGNFARFDAEGRAAVDGLVYRSVAVGRGAVAYVAADLGTDAPDLELDAGLADVRTDGVAFDTVSADGRYRGVPGEGTGELVVEARSPDDTEYRADLAFDLSLDRSEIRLADLRVRGDTVTWELAGPGAVGWGGGAVDVEGIELVSDAGGRILADGRLPGDGSGDLELRVEALELEQLGSALQLEARPAGRLDLDARVEGTLAAPRLEGTGRLVDGRLAGEPIPEIRATFEYAGAELFAEAELLRNDVRLAEAVATVPIDLSLSPDPLPRLLDGPLTVDLRADSLPVDAVPGLAREIEEAAGHVRGEVAIRGTVDAPRFSGDVDLDLGAIAIAPLGVRLENVTGALTLDGDEVRVDSLVAHSGGPLRIDGRVGVASLRDPTFDLEVTAREALVIDTDDVTLEVDGDLTVGGSLAAIEVEGDVRTRRGVIMVPPLSELGQTGVVALHSPAGANRIETEFLRDLRLLERERPLLDRLVLDLAVTIDRDVWVRSVEANVEVYTPAETGPLRVRSQPGGDLVLEGVLAADRGEYEFMSRRFELTRGSTTFVGEPGLNPILQVAAEHEVRLPGREAFAVRVLLGGTLRDPEITLESTAQPPIAQTDLLYYVAFGGEAVSLLHRQGSPLSGQGGGAGDLAGNVAGLATQQLGTLALDAVTNDIEADLMRDLGVDVFRITPADLPADLFTGGYGDLLRSTEIEAGRYVSSRLFVAGQVNTGAARPGLRVEYLTIYGVEWRTAWRSRWMPTEPTLAERNPRRTGVLSSFLVREWRF